ncbi:PREDICTED: uncharacterized protein LOC109588717 [Amphimedon queenslandica]|uniref:Fibronectin type-III domain-containing protein n=1 Tax=Amphimedon queenslandica TaxID=400682 RepID=A0AAN0JTM3_AMPQE|nr:PREDICTED: uncharacterized protein LOC109588717 [Amphimedon queenslandica]|eukprot:XP_019860394.1 PREDICTED: uncharacterized protein LOC109588717 [Amphimedon queenslandica]
MLLNTVALLLGVELILLYSGLADGVITNFQCTDGPVCAGDSIECRCTTDTGTLEWFISYSLVEPLKWNLIPVVSFFRNKTESEGYYGYNFTFNTTYTGLNTSILTFNLNHSESVLIECANGEVIHKMNTTVTDLGYYAKAPTNLTTTFNPSRITLEWEDTGNNCTSTVYQVTLNATMTSELTYHNTNKTTIFINSSELNITEVYTYTVRGWNGQQSNISNPFTLGPINVTDVVIINVTEAINTDPCKNNSCCANVTLNIILELSESDTSLKYPIQNYSISYHSITENMAVTYKFRATVLMPGVVLKYNEAYCLTVTPMNNFSTGEPKNVNITIDEYQCPPSENNGNGGLSAGAVAGIIIGAIAIIVTLFLVATIY